VNDAFFSQQEESRALYDKQEMRITSKSLSCIVMIFAKYQIMKSVYLLPYCAATSHLDGSAGDLSLENVH